MNPTRRQLLAMGASALALPRLRRRAAAMAPARPSASVAPALFVSHGTPLFLPGNEARVAELRAWGATLPLPRGVVVLTPHFASRTPQLGRSAPGFAMYNLPGPIKRQLPQDLEYETPSSDALAARLDGLLGPGLARPPRRGFDHTTWMPLRCLFPEASVPVLELGYSYLSPAAAFALGKTLAVLRDENLLFLASGGMTHNLAAGPPLDRRLPASADKPASWVVEFDEWAADRLEQRDADSLINFRDRAPAVELAHPDDGAHYRVLLVALGIALHAKAALRAIRFPVTGIEATQSKRCVELG
jgi:4,5-DOPA dioxygenase extradiol